MSEKCRNDSISPTHQANSAPRRAALYSAGRPGEHAEGDQLAEPARQAVRCYDTQHVRAAGGTRAKRVTRITRVSGFSRHTSYVTQATQRLTRQVGPGPAVVVATAAFPATPRHHHSSHNGRMCRIVALVVVSHLSWCRACLSCDAALAAPTAQLSSPAGYHTRHHWTSRPGGAVRLYHLILPFVCCRLVGGQIQTEIKILLTLFERGVRITEPRSPVQSGKLSQPPCQSASPPVCQSASPPVWLSGCHCEEYKCEQLW